MIRKEEDISLLHWKYKQTLGLNYLSVQLVRLVFIQGYKDRGVRLNSHFHLGPRLKASEAARPLPMRNGEIFKFSISRHSLLKYSSKHAFHLSSHIL
jgi:hypothetical protein